MANSPLFPKGGRISSPALQCSISRLLFLLVAGLLVFGAEIASAVTCYEDNDGDGFGDPFRPVDCPVDCSCLPNLVSNDLDCDDFNASINPDASEVCNSLDDDCDGSIDEGAGTTWYADADGDGFGNPTSFVVDCSQPVGYVADNTDCDDLDPAIHPNGTEVCNGLDDDCDGAVDEDAGSTWYADIDGDGYGDASNTTAACDQPPGYVTNDTDCDDSDPSVHPNATEVCNGVDDDCDGTIDEDAGTTWYADTDSDGYGNPTSFVISCSQPAGHVADNTDCDDTDPAIHPNAVETCNSIDDDCDGAVDEDAGVTWYADLDGDGYGDASNPTVACDQPPGYVTNNTDCNDADPSVHPNAVEVCNDIDDDCDGTVNEDAGTTWYADTDADGYGDASNTTVACDQPQGYVTNDTDCDDADAAVHPNAAEVCNGVDDDCDGTVDEDAGTTWYADADGDGYGNPTSFVVDCSQPAGHVADNTDCDDTDAGVNPGAAEIPDDGIDQDCDGADMVTCCDVVGDPNGDGTVNVSDAVYIINYVFKGGPGPICK